MEPWLGMALCWGLFAATHIGLATLPVREALVSRFGERGFGVLFSLVASCSYAIVIAYYAQHRFEGAPGLALGHIAPLRWMLIAAICAGIMLMAATFAGYARSPYAVLGDGVVRSPRGVERVTRHPFFVGLAVVALAHCLLATRLVGAVFAAGLAAVSLVGAWHQDRKLLARRGTSFAAYIAATSMLPFGAIVSGRQRLEAREIPWNALLVGAALAAGLRWWHASIFAYGGAFVIAATVGGAVIISVHDVWIARRRSMASPRRTVLEPGLGSHR